MVTNNADITILGRVSKKVSGLLGPLGSLSINTFINFIRGIGFLPSTPNSGIIDIIGIKQNSCTRVKRKKEIQKICCNNQR